MMNTPLTEQPMPKPSVLRLRQISKWLGFLGLYVVSAFIVAGFFQQESKRLENIMLERDGQWAVERIGARLQLVQESLVKQGQQTSFYLLDAWNAASRMLLQVQPELDFIALYNVQSKTLPSLVSLSQTYPHYELDERALQDALRVIVTNGKPFVQISSGSASSTRRDYEALSAQFYVPIYEANDVPANPQGILIARVQIGPLVLQSIPAEFFKRYQLRIVSHASLARNTGLSSAVEQASASFPITFFNQPLSLELKSSQNLFVWFSSLQFWASEMVVLLLFIALFISLRARQALLAAQYALEEGIAFRQAMESSSGIGLFSMDLRGKITYVNQAFLALSGFDARAIQNCPLPFPFCNAQVNELITRVLEMPPNQHPTAQLECRLICHDQSDLHVNMVITPLFDGARQHCGWVASLTDINQAHKTSEQLLTSRQQFLRVLEELDAVVSVLDLKNKALLFSNPLYFQLFGKSEHGHVELAGEKFLEPAKLKGPTPNANWSETQQAIEAARAQHFVADRQIGERWFSVRVQPLLWVDGRSAQLLIATDITKRLEVEDIRRQTQERAQSASRLLTMGEMASSIAHELNQPLAAISNYCEGLIARLAAPTQPATTDVSQAIKKISSQAQRAGNVILRIREFVRKSAPNVVLCNPYKMVDTAVELAEIEFRKRKSKICTIISPDLPNLKADPILIEQVLINLLRNAAESVDMAGRQGADRTVTLSVSTKGNEMLFSVLDCGLGITPEVQAGLFTPFVTTKPGGIGIGLSTCRSIIEKHRGRIWAENQVGEDNLLMGCRFSFTLPLNQNEARDLSSKDENR